MTAPMILDGAMHGAAFLAYVQQVLVPTLSPGDIVVMDNLPVHKPQAVREAIEPAGAQLRFLPPYSPDFNPIEMAFSKFKDFLKKTAARTVDDLWDAIARPSTSSHQTNARTTSPPQDMTGTVRKPPPPAIMPTMFHFVPLLFRSSCAD